MKLDTCILGAGVTGLAAGYTSKLTGYDAALNPGGICSSYYVRPGETRSTHETPKDGNAYRFEIGGGHWIFGGDPLALRFMRSLAPMKEYTRKSSVFLPDHNTFVPYPIQNHLRFLGPETSAKALSEMVAAQKSNGAVGTMHEWLQRSFGPTLCEMFFDPFHEAYTAGLWKSIATQDGYKSPVELSLAVRGAFSETSAVGYNTKYVYPEDGLNTLAQRMAAQCDIRYGKRVVRIDVSDKVVYFEDGSAVDYNTLISTLPLNRMMEFTGLSVDAKPNPSSAVLVLNIGAIQGPRCPDDHWVYLPSSKAGFHRVGFYSNVDESFLPVSRRKTPRGVSIYVEKAYSADVKPSESEIQNVCRNTVKELQSWEWIAEVEVVDPTWIDVAYTWSWPGSKWRDKAIKILEANDIYPVGRFARWTFQGIADSIRDGLMAGAAIKGHK